MYLCKYANPLILLFLKDMASGGSESWKVSQGKAKGWDSDKSGKAGF